MKVAGAIVDPQFVAGIAASGAGAEQVAERAAVLSSAHAEQKVLLISLEDAIEVRSEAHWNQRWVE